MDTKWVLLPCLLLGVWGCGAKTTVATGPDGEKITTDAQGNMTVEDGKGGRVDVTSQGDSWTAKSSDGTEFSVSEGGMTGQTEKGEKFSMGTADVSEAELGLPFYPGSERVQSRDMKSEADGKSVVISYRSTTDAPSKVAEFYKSRLEGVTTTASDQVATLSGKLKDGTEVVVSAISMDGKTEVSVAASRDK